MTNRTDNFNRASGAIGTPSDGGSAWQFNGTWSIFDSIRAYESTGTTDTSCVLETSETSGTVQVTVPVITTSSACGIILRWTDNNNYVLANGGGQVGFAGPIAIYTKIGGSFTQIGTSTSEAFANGDVLSFEVSGNNFTFKVNGVTKATATTSHNSTATKHGLRAASDNGTRFDDFSFTGSGGGGGSIVGAGLSSSPLLSGRLLRGLTR